MKRLAAVEQAILEADRWELNRIKTDEWVRWSYITMYQRDGMEWEGN